MKNKNKSKLIIASFSIGTILFAAVEADNTKVNSREQLTAQDQSKGSDADVEITRKIRSHVVDDKNLSTYAHNVKIITLAGVVTLKGPVNSADEKLAIVKHAQMVVKPNQIKNELEVTKKK